MASATPGEHHTHWSDLMAIGAGMAIAASGIGNSTTWMSAVGLVLGAAGFSAIRGYRWASIAYLALGLILLLAFAAWINLKGFSWNAAAGEAGSVLCVGLAVIKVRRDSESRGVAPRKEPAASMVLLQRHAPYLDDRLLASIASSALGGPFTTVEDETQQYVLGEVPTFLVKSNGGCYLVHHSAKPFWDPDDAVEQQVVDVRAQRAIREHRAWVSIDFIGPADRDAVARGYDEIGKLLSELSGAETLAVLLPDRGSFRAWDDTAAKTLRSGSPLECFSSRSLTPVVPVAPDDPVMAVAIAEARRRWPEFLRAFAGHHPEQHFSVKAPVTRGGQTEHIWIDVTAITADYVRGNLGNEPVDLSGLKLGDPISVPVSAVEDWIYVLTDEPVGGFTIPAVTSAPRRTRKN